MPYPAPPDLLPPGDRTTATRWQPVGVRTIEVGSDAEGIWKIGWLVDALRLGDEQEAIFQGSGKDRHLARPFLEPGETTSMLWTNPGRQLWIHATGISQE